MRNHGIEHLNAGRTPLVSEGHIGKRQNVTPMRWLDRRRAHACQVLMPHAAAVCLRRDYLRKYSGRFAALFGVLLLAGCNANEHLSFLVPQGPIANAERWHFWLVVGILVIFVAGPVFLLTPWLAWHYRYGAKKSRYDPKWKDNKALTFMTWAGPIVIVIVLGYFIWDNAHMLDPYKPLASEQPALAIQAIGYDWKWLFIYPEQRIATIGVLPIRTDEPVAMQLTSATVMQSLLIPALVGQIYAMGGMVSQLHFEATHSGRSLGENTMYDGNGFHQQKFTAIAMTPAKFRAWVRHVQATGLPLNARTLHAIEQRGTKARLLRTLPPGASSDGNVYLKDVPSDLFATVVKATMDGKPVALAAAGSAPATRTAAIEP